MKDELKNYMQAKANKLMESDPIKKEIGKIKLKLYQEKVMEDECNDKECVDYRSAECEEFDSD